MKFTLTPRLVATGAAAMGLSGAVLLNSNCNFLCLCLAFNFEEIPSGKVMCTIKLIQLKSSHGEILFLP
jgi:hypothetical protein